MRDRRPAVSGELKASVAATDATPGALEAQVSAETLSRRALAWRRFRRHKPALIGGLLLLLIAAATLLAGVLSPYEFRELDLDAIREGPSPRHLFGTDTLGRDEFTRVLYGGRISLLVAVTAALSSGVLGAFVGSIAGYYGGWVDNLLMRITDLFLAIPLLVVLIIAASALSDTIPQPWGIVVTLSIFFWMPLARIVRGLFLSLKEKEFVEAARALGASNARIIFGHILPNAMGPIVVAVTLSVAGAILNESVLSFFGFGIEPPTPSWGNMLAESRNLITAAPWLLWFPGLMILITVLCVNFLGDGLRDALDPHQQLKGAA